ncbi:response regulator transcription factor [Merdibacter massiliensis]|uniref:response regulator transcription factor n=1 Tax=Merdibacter massiliensis TaxID=1871030 RepID=UPI00096A7425|nr:response regulator transcription factor [Merdibacter massiliensis]
MIKVMIADDQELMRESLQILLSTKDDIQICGLAKDGEEVLQLVAKEQPDVILMDIRMPQMNGVQCTKQIKEHYPQIAVIVLTTFDDDEYIYDALKYGASSYLLKGVSLEELYQAIVTVAGGGGVIQPQVAIKAMRMFSDMAKSQVESDISIADIEHLSMTEWKIIASVANGLSNKEIAGELSFTEGTVRNYISVILDKLALRDRTQLAIWAVSNQRLVYKGLNEK